MSNYNCKFCKDCDGHGCIGEMPGMGGVLDSAIFIKSCADWKKYAQFADGEAAEFRLAPMAGIVQNVGWADEWSFFLKLLEPCAKKKIRIALGDGKPDDKFLSGVEAAKKFGQKAAIFSKPYENARILERFEMAGDVAEIVGTDIDAYNIVVMRGKANLEKKTAAQLRELMRQCKKPFAIKGIFTKDDLDMLAEVKPDIAVISNHGGRVENKIGSSIDFFVENNDFIRKNCGQVWIDSGVRTLQDLKIARHFGATEALVGRPFITALCKDGEKGVEALVDRLRNGL